VSVLLDTAPANSYDSLREPMPILKLPRSDAPPWRARALVFEDPLSHELLSSLEQIAPTDATVLVTGETGTGKEIVARQVHACSARAHAPFVAVNSVSHRERALRTREGSLHGGRGVASGLV
jgi:DNA-binding NtrC family response regulator